MSFPTKILLVDLVTSMLPLPLNTIKSSISEHSQANSSFLKERKENDFIFERKFILTENKIKVRAGYTLKSQWFKINDDLLQIGYYYNPITAGLFNKKYNICGVLLLQDAQTKYKNFDKCLQWASCNLSLSLSLKAGSEMSLQIGWQVFVCPKLLS